MANDFYNHGSWPATGGPGASAPARAELDAITAGFDKLPPLTGNAGRAVVVNPGANGLTVTAGTLALAGNLALTGAFALTLAMSATITLTMPSQSGTLPVLASGGTAGMLPYISAPGILSLSAVGAAGQAVLSGGTGAPTFTTGTLALAGNFATTGAFNTTFAQQATTTLTLPAVNGTLATLAGTETLTGKSITLAGGINEKITTVASGATPDIFAQNVGNLIDYTGSVTATGFTAAPQAGCRRELLVAGSPAFTDGANLVIAGGSYVASPGDRLLVIAETTTKFRMFPLPEDGSPGYFPYAYVLIPQPYPFL